MNEASTRPWIVMKFGGTSVSSKERWATICTQARTRLGEGDDVLIVVSALAGVTNLLTALADEAQPDRREVLLDDIIGRHRLLAQAFPLGECPEFENHAKALAQLARGEVFPVEGSSRAELLAHGELMSSALGARVLQAAGLPAILQDARTLLRAAPEFAANPLSVRCTDEADLAMAGRLAEAGRLHITQGFIAAGPDGSTCLLGRGGSDTSAACLAARLQARVLEIWTDVPGMFSADPRIVPDARLLREIDYSEAQELASMGAKVLHPPSVQPVARHGIPLYIRDTGHPEAEGTRIAGTDQRGGAQVKGVVSRKGITLINMQSPAMWRQVGFLADAFAIFKRHGFSVDLISTSESAVTVSLDPETGTDPGGRRQAAFLEDLTRLCGVEVHSDCVSISLVGTAIRTNLGRLSAALDVFHDRRVHMVTQSANDLNLTLVVDAEHADSLVRKLHQSLISSQAEHRREFGPSWLDINRTPDAQPPAAHWWQQQAGQLVELMRDRTSAYVYSLDVARVAARRLKTLKTVDRVLYAVKANDHPEILRALAGEGLGFECVSLAEVQHVLRVIPALSPSNVLFTPNFAPRDEYRQAFDLGVQVTVDNSWILREWAGLFSGREIFLRLDLESGHGHHRKVVTMGKDSKFGIALDHLDDLPDHLAAHGIHVRGLHAHTGSGVSDVGVWREQLARLLAVVPRFGTVEVLDIGGGFGVPERSLEPGLDLAALDAQLAEALGGQRPRIWLEPGRYVVAESGVLLARVTQLKDKGGHHYVGVATGMNSLIRPALYGAYHEIVNLTRLHEPAVCTARVVGPICESGDVIGESRLLSECREGDVMLIANCGAYGRVMASNYNRRAPAEELVLGT